jgi:hypothetical protein
MRQSDRMPGGDFDLVTLGVDGVRTLLSRADLKDAFYYGLAHACNRIATDFATRGDLKNALEWGQITQEAFDRVAADPYFADAERQYKLETSKMLVSTFLIAMFGTQPEVSFLLDPVKVREGLEKGVANLGGIPGVESQLIKPASARTISPNQLSCLSERIGLVVPLIQGGRVGKEFEAWHELKIKVDRALGATSR